MNAMNFLIAIAPLLLLVAALCLERYPGETAITKLRRFVEHALGVTPRKPVLCEPVPGFDSPVRGGLLIASSLAGRGPPLDQ